MKDRWRTFWTIMSIIGLLGIVGGVSSYIYILENTEWANIPDIEKKLLVILPILFYCIYEIIYISIGKSLSKEPFKKNASFWNFLMDNLVILCVSILTTFGVLGLKNLPKTIYKFMSYIYHIFKSAAIYLYELIFKVFNKWVLIAILIILIVLLFKYALYKIFKKREELRIKNEKIKGKK